MKKIKKNIEKTIHKHRVIQEKIFQYLIKCECFGPCKLEDLHGVSHRLMVIVTNEISKEEYFGIADIVTDERANDTQFIHHIMDKMLLNKDKQS